MPWYAASRHNRIISPISALCDLLYSDVLRPRIRRSSATYRRVASSYNRSGPAGRSARHIGHNFETPYFRRSATQVEWKEWAQGSVERVDADRASMQIAQISSLELVAAASPSLDIRSSEVLIWSFRCSGATQNFLCSPLVQCCFWQSFPQY